MLMRLGNYGWGMGFGGGMGFGWLFFFIFWLLVILGVVYSIKMLMGRGGSALPVDTPLDILKKRYARGEISREEFERMRQDISLTK